MQQPDFMADMRRKKNPPVVSRTGGIYGDWKSVEYRSEKIPPVDT